ncbi:MAG: hypothetical protein NXI31_21555 [bacterium]|nr:hypothetical protein [bacterium]
MARSTSLHVLIVARFVRFALAVAAAIAVPRDATPRAQSPDTPSPEAQSPKVQPEAPAEPQLGPGPLLAFTAVVTDRPRIVAVHIAELTPPEPTAKPKTAEPKTDAPPPALITTHEIYRGPGGVRVLKRLGRDHILLALRQPSRLVTVEVRTGRMRELIRGDVRFAGQRGDDVVFVEGRGKTAHLAAVPWRRPGMPVRLAEQPLARVPRIAGNLAFAIAPDDREVWVVSLASGRSRRLWRAPAGHGRLRIALAPGGQHLAIGAVDRGHRGHLTVIDTATGSVLSRAANLPIWLSPLSSSTPTLEVAFAGDRHVVCSETRGDPRGIQGEFVHVTRAIETGEITDEAPYSGLAINHRAPEPKGQAPRFEIRRNRERASLHELGNDTPLAERPRQHEQYEDLLIAPSGRFATARLGDRRRHLALFAPGRPPRQLSRHWCHNLVWLPPAR